MTSSLTFKCVLKKKKKMLAQMNLVMSVCKYRNREDDSLKLKTTKAKQVTTIPRSRKRTREKGFSSDRSKKYALGRACDIFKIFLSGFSEEVALRDTAPKILSVQYPINIKIY